MVGEYILRLQSTSRLPALDAPACIYIAQIEGLQREAATPEHSTCTFLAGRAHAQVTSRSVDDNVCTAR